MKQKATITAKLKDDNTLDISIEFDPELKTAGPTPMPILTFVQAFMETLERLAASTKDGETMSDQTSNQPDEIRQLAEKIEKRLFQETRAIVDGNFDNVGDIESILRAANVRIDAGELRPGMRVIVDEESPAER